ncbi:MAG: hypothetical protein DRP42_07790 [Tenericutes bacterium]|nr:MAG: hypothetical protein DRP42_07790 [Mycoplasmatota bacterium]
MATFDPRSLSYTEEERRLGSKINPYGNTTQYADLSQSQRQAAKRAKLRANRQVVASVGDDFSTLADKLGINAIDLAKANKGTNKVSAGASYNVPNYRQVEAELDAQNEINARNAMLPRYEPGGDQTYQQWLDSLQPGQLTTPPGGHNNWFDAWVEKNTNLKPGEVGTPEYWTDNPLGKFFWDLLRRGNEREQIGVGLGAGIFLPGKTDSPAFGGGGKPPRYPGGKTAPLGDAPVDFSRRPEWSPEGSGFYTDGNVDWERGKNPAEFRTGEFYTTGNVEFPDIAPKMPIRFQPNEFYTSQYWGDRETAGYEPPKTTSSIEERRRGTDIYGTGTIPSELQKLKIPQNPSAFEAVNWLTGAGLTGTAMLSAGHQLRLDRPEYWDATGAREDVIEGMEKFLVAEFANPDGTIDWDRAMSQDPYVVDTLTKLGYLDEPEGMGNAEDSIEYGGYNYPIPSYSSKPYLRPSGYTQRGSDMRRGSQLGLVSWSI